MKALKVLLWLCGIGFMTAFIFAVLPWEMIGKVYLLFGEEPLPGTAPVMYLVRVTNVLSGLIGVYFILIALDPPRYRLLIYYSAIGFMMCGVFCFVVGLSVGVPPQFYLGDGLFGVVIGLLLAILASRATKTQT